MSLVFVTPYLFAACGDNLQPEPGTQGSVLGADEPTPDAGGGDAAIRAIVADLTLTSPRCDAAAAGYEVRALYADDRTQVANVRCHLAFDDGTTADDCVGEHVFAVPGEHTFAVEVEDLASGATAALERRGEIEEPLAVDVSLTQPSCGLSFDVSLAAPIATEKRITVTPGDKVVGDSGGLFGANAHVEVTEAGTYTVRAYVEQERETGPICTFSKSLEVTVAPCDHEHTPACADWP